MGIVTNDEGICRHHDRRSFNLPARFGLGDLHSSLVERAFGYGINKLKTAAIFLLATVILLVAVGLIWEFRATLGK